MCVCFKQFRRGATLIIPVNVPVTFVFEFLLGRFSLSAVFYASICSTSAVGFTPLLRIHMCVLKLDCDFERTSQGASLYGCSFLFSRGFGREKSPSEVPTASETGPCKIPALPGQRKTKNEALQAPKEPSEIAVVQVPSSCVFPTLSQRKRHYSMSQTRTE